MEWKGGRGRRVDERGGRGHGREGERKAEMRVRLRLGRRKSSAKWVGCSCQRCWKRAVGVFEDLESWKKGEAEGEANDICKIFGLWEGCSQCAPSAHRGKHFDENPSRFGSPRVRI